MSYLILWLVFSPVSNIATGGGATAIAALGAPVVIVQHDTMQRCKAALKTIRDEAPHLQGVCVLK
jgi:hypothetical protein